MVTALDIGDRAPAMPLLEPDGSTWAPPWDDGRPAVLVFHRHLA